jgi:hypothetical protein
LFALSALPGCMTLHPTAPVAASPVYSGPTYALAVAVRGGVQPTPNQWNALYDKFSASLAARGLQLINDSKRADYIIYLEFLPDPLDPNLGTALVSSVSPNTGSYGRSPTPTVSTYTASYWPSSYGGYNTYGGYDSSYYNNPTYTPAVATDTTTGPVTPVVPPHHVRLNPPPDCPPGTYVTPPGYVGSYPHRNHPHDGFSSGGNFNSGRNEPVSSSSTVASANAPHSASPDVVSGRVATWTANSYAGRTHGSDSASANSRSSSDTTGKSHWWSSSSSSDSSSSGRSGYASSDASSGHSRYTSSDSSSGRTSWSSGNSSSATSSTH